MMIYVIATLIVLFLLIHRINIFKYIAIFISIILLISNIKDGTEDVKGLNSRFIKKNKIN